MIATRKIACPSCSVGLKIAESLPVGKEIDCPKCSTTFKVPSRKAQIASAPQPASKPRKSAPAPVDEEEPEEEEQPRRRKKKPRKQEPASNAPLILGLILGSLVIIGAGVGLILALRPSDQKTEAVADNSSNKAGASGGAGAGATEPDPPRERRPRNPGRGAGGQNEEPGRRGGSGEEGAPRTRGGRGSASGNEGAPAGGGGDQFAAARSLFSQTCANCHTVPGGGGRGRGGPNLSTVGRDPTHTTDWLAQFIANPKSVKPSSRMKAFEGILSAAEIRSLADYLVTLK